MKIHLKFLLVSMLVFVSFFSLTSFNSSTVHAKETVDLEGGQLVDNRTLVPLRSIFEELGSTVNWNQKDKTVTATKGTNKIKLTIGSRHTTVNGNHVIIDVPAQIKNGSTLVPLRFVSEALGASVEWDSQNYVATITSSDKVINVYLPQTSSPNNQIALNLVKDYFDHDSSLSYSIENLHGGEFFLVEARADFGSGFLSLVDAFIIVPDMYSNNLYIQNVLSEDYDSFWYIAEAIRSGNFG